MSVKEPESVLFIMVLSCKSTCKAMHPSSEMGHLKTEQKNVTYYCS